MSEGRPCARVCPCASACNFIIEALAQGVRSGIFIVNFEDISHLFLVFLLLTWDRLMIAGLTSKALNTLIYCNQHQAFNTLIYFYCRFST